MPLLRDLWVEATDAIRQHPADEAIALRVFWLALAMSRVYLSNAHTKEWGGDSEGSEKDHLQRRAVLETAFHLFGDQPYAYIVQCRLACAASRAGDPLAAREWLAECDPYPPMVDLDSEFRIALCMIHLAENNPQGILQVIGPRGQEIPLAMMRNQLLGDGLRIHGHHAIGDTAKAKALVKRAIQAHGRPVLTGALIDYRLAGSIGKWLLVRNLGTLLFRFLLLALLIAALIIGIWHLVNP